MQRYQDSVLIQSLTGQTTIAGVGLTVTVYKAGTATLATIYSDNIGTIINQLTAPVTTDSTGRFEFYAENGRYDLTISGASITTINILDVLLEDMAAFFGGNYADASGTASDMLVSYPNAPVTVLSDGYPLEVDTSIVGFNAGAVTITPTLKGVVQATAAVVRHDSLSGTLVPLDAGDMPQIAQLRYLAATQQWVLINPVIKRTLLVSVASNTVSMSNGFYTQIAALLIPVGIWELSGSVALAPAATTSTSVTVVGIHSSVALGSVGTYARQQFSPVVTGGAELTALSPTVLVEVSTPTTYYLSAGVNFSVSTLTAGGLFKAVRIGV